MATRAKEPGDARGYLPWAGWFADPKLSPKAFADLPEWRQREVLGVAPSPINISYDYLNSAPQIPELPVYSD